MNKLLKVFLAIIGGINVIFSLFIPIAISLVITKMYNLVGFRLYLVIIIGSLSTFYRAIEIAGIDTLDYIIENFKNGNGNITRKKYHR